MQRSLSILGVAFLAAVVTMSAGATPIHDPHALQLRAQPASPQRIDFAPARAGWNGSETRVFTAHNNSFLAFEEMEMQQARRAVTDLLIPDPAVWAALLATIFGCRLLATRRKPALAEVISITSGNSMPKAA